VEGDAGRSVELAGEAGLEGAVAVEPRDLVLVLDKIAFGPWLLPVLRGLAGLRRLRGTAIDPLRLIGEPGRGRARKGGARWKVMRAGPSNSRARRAWKAPSLWFGPWLLPVLRGLAGLRRLRGTAIDPLRLIGERREERAVLAPAGDRPRLHRSVAADRHRGGEQVEQGAAIVAVEAAAAGADPGAGVR
jgi:hypothetical protein